MLFYVLKLLILLPLIGGLAWASLWLARKAQARMVAGTGERAVKVIETQMLGPGLRLAVLEFHGREILVSAGKGGLVRLAEAPAREARP
ncbi:MAG: FliO/MopB family protein [Sphingomonadales bacterium]|nr:FliO/MopB family protein [Sphingomonadales bacterium]MDE2569049.1 FliO/MopB family protein [Sphingomonadales bacterium]